MFFFTTAPLGLAAWATARFGGSASALASASGIAARAGAVAVSADDSKAGTDVGGRESSGPGAGPGGETVAWPAVTARCGSGGIVATMPGGLDVASVLARDIFGGSVPAAFSTHASSMTFG